MGSGLPPCPQRRALLATLFTGAAGLSLAAATGARAAPARPKAKATKQSVQYQDTPMDIRMCATCTAFEAPKSCAVVEGEVSKKGWCTLFALVD